MNFCFLWAILQKMCLPHPYTTLSLTFLVHWQIFPNFACRGHIRKSSNFNPILVKQTKFVLVRPSPDMYIHFPNFFFFKWTMTDPTIKRAYLRILFVLADSIKPILGTCQKEVNNYYHWFSCDSWRPQGRVACLGVFGKLPGIDCRRFLRSPHPSLCSLFFALPPSFVPFT